MNGAERDLYSFDYQPMSDKEWIDLIKGTPRIKRHKLFKERRKTRELEHIKEVWGGSFPRGGSDLVIRVITRFPNMIFSEATRIPRIGIGEAKFRTKYVASRLWDLPQAIKSNLRK